jgi:hypothetical protein
MLGIGDLGNEFQVVAHRMTGCELPHAASSLREQAVPVRHEQEWDIAARKGLYLSRLKNLLSHSRLSGGD